MAKKLSDNGLKPKVARAYIRVSYQGERGKNPRGGEFISPDMQLNEAKDYARMCLKDYEFDEEASTINADIDKSASRLKWRKRTGLVAHLEAAQRGEFDVLIVYKLSRFARNAKEGLELYDLFEEAGCSICSTRDKIDTTSAMGQMMRTILFAVSQMESDNISDFAKSSAKARAQRGLPHGSLAFWVSRNESDEYILNDRAPDIRRLIDLKLEGMANSKIARKLNSEDVRTREGRKWTSDRVRRYIHPDRIDLLLGHYTYGPDKEEGDPDRIEVPNLFPAVITQEEKEQILAVNRQMIQLYGSGGPRKAANTTYVLSGVFRCGACGGRMQSSTSRSGGGKPRTTYQCRAYPDDNIPHPDGNNVSSDMVEDAVMRVVQVAAQDYKQQFESAPAAKPIETDNGSVLDKRINALTERILRLNDAYSDGLMKKEDYKISYDKYDREREKLRSSRKEIDSTAALKFMMKEALTTTDGLGLTTQQARMLVLACVEKVEGAVGVDPKRTGLPKATRCRGVWVTLRLPLIDGTKKVLAPMYDARFKGERLILDKE